MSDNTWEPKPVRGDVESWMDTVWEPLWEWHAAHEGRAAEGTETYEQRWDDICTAMSWIAQRLEEAV